MSYKDYGPLEKLIGKWESDGFSGDNRAPDPNRNVENTKFRQFMTFEPIGDVENHEQLLYALRYNTEAWEEGDESGPFHEETGYFIWDKGNSQVLKSFIVPRGIAVNAGGTYIETDGKIKVKAELGSNTYGLCSNLFLDKKFKTLSYELEISVSDGILSYEENTRIKIEGQENIFDHIEKNTLKRI